MADSGFCLTSDGDHATLEPCMNVPSQKWTFDENTKAMINVGSGDCLERHMHAPGPGNVGSQSDTLLEIATHLSPLGEGRGAGSDALEEGGVAPPPPHGTQYIEPRPKPRPGSRR